jgi:hypothetical protein
MLVPFGTLRGGADEVKQLERGPTDQLGPAA